MDMNLTLQFLGGVVIAIVTGVVTLYGQRMITRNSAKAQEAQITVEERKVSQGDFDRLVDQYEKDRQRVIHYNDQMSGWLATTLTHLRKMHRFWERALPMLPSEVRAKYPRVPDEIKSLPAWLYGDDDEPSS